MGKNIQRKTHVFIGKCHVDRGQGHVEKSILKSNYYISFEIEPELISNAGMIL